MRETLFLAALLGVAGCIGAGGDPALRGVPHPSSGAMAAAAAGVAGAVTLASPDAAAKNSAETKKAYDVKNTKGVTVKETVPEGVLDRADAQEAKKQQASAPAAPTAPVPAEAGSAAAPPPAQPINLFPPPPPPPPSAPKPGD